MNRQLQIVQQYAREMAAELPAIGQAQRILPNGTYLQMLGRNGHRTLIVGHPEHQPQLEDVEEIARAFAIPGYSEPVAGPQRVASRVLPNVRVKALTYTWLDADADRTASIAGGRRPDPTGPQLRLFVHGRRSDRPPRPGHHQRSHSWTPSEWAPSRSTSAPP